MKQKSIMTRTQKIFKAKQAVMNAKTNEQFFKALAAYRAARKMGK